MTTIAIVGQAETTKGIVPGATGTGTTHAAADVLTGGAGSDTFYMTAGGAITRIPPVVRVNTNREAAC